jgi:hypothetical protein
MLIKELLEGTIYDIPALSKRIITMQAQGMTDDQIRAQLTKEGIPTRYIEQAIQGTELVRESTTSNPVAKAAQKVAKGSGQHKNPKRALEVPRKEKHKKSIPMAEAAKTAREKWIAASNARDKKHQEHEAEISKLPKEKRSGAAIDALAKHLDSNIKEITDVERSIAATKSLPAIDAKLQKHQQHRKELEIQRAEIDKQLLQKDKEDQAYWSKNAPQATRIKKAATSLEGYQDFNKVEPYYVCFAGKPIKKFDYYEDARRFHDNWKKKLYREGNTAKADKITLMPVMDESGKASRALCNSSRPDSQLGASNLASCKSQGLRARDGEKSHLIGHGGAKVRITVGGKKIKGKKYGGPLPDYGTRKGQ